MSICLALLGALSAASTSACAGDPVAGPAIAESSAAQPQSGPGAPAFAVRDSGFVHLGIGSSITPQVNAGGHPLRARDRALLPTVWTVRDTTVARSSGAEVSGRAQGVTWLVWSEGASLDSTVLVVSPPPVGYLSPRLANLTVGGAGVTLVGPPGDSVVMYSLFKSNEAAVAASAELLAPPSAGRWIVRGQTANQRSRVAVVWVAEAVDSTPPTPEDPTPPLPPLEREVSLRLHRFVGAEASTVTSNAIPLPPGWAFPASLDSITLRVNGVEVPAHVAALYGKHPDGSLKSILVQASITPAMVDDGAKLAIGTKRSKPRAALDSIPLPNTTGVLLPTDAEYLVSTQIVGNTVSRARSRFGPPQFDSYESLFDSNQERLWVAYGHQWGQNYYDRVQNWYAFWVRTGNPVFFERASRMAIDYRRGYLEFANYGAAEWWAYLEGLALHYWLSGDEKSRIAVYMTAASLHGSRGMERLEQAATHGWMDNRVQSKVLGAKVLAILLEAPSAGSVVDWRAAARIDLGRILSTQAADGAYRFGNICNESNNFMSAMLSSVLISYHSYVDADARIPTAIERNMDWMRRTQWRPADQVFNYYSGQCTDGGPSAAGDLNGFFMESLGWLATYTGDRLWIDFGDAVLKGVVEKTWMTPSKMFNQAYHLSWRYHWHRARFKP